MNTLLLRLAGPMQAWSTQSRFSDRDAGREPSKSGVVGLLCAALGRPRTEPVDDLAELGLGVRVDQEGTLLVDYQTAGGGNFRGRPYGVAKANRSTPETVVSRRAYLADASFLVGLESTDGAFLETLDRAVARPVWPLCLGRKAFPPGEPVALPGGGLRLGFDLATALTKAPWRSQQPTRFVLEVPPGSSPDQRTDQPVGAAFATRRFTLRSVVTEFRSPLPSVADQEAS
ncbi:MAG: type I-E CRISPR-associated protein Cas5/CasD [Rhizobiales bacterium]|nr:type I-E CRISPR-associated protein Cas5/CasD [Hyphomicrobiales bacterium]